MGKVKNNDVPKDELGTTIALASFAVTGTKFLYDIGKDITIHNINRDIILHQILDSSFEDGHHRISLSLINASIHGMQIREIDIPDIEKDEFDVFEPQVKQTSAGMLAKIQQSVDKEKLCLPKVLNPSEILDLNLRINEIKYKGIKKKNGLSATITYHTFDQGKPNKYSIFVRLLWDQ